MSEIVLPYQIAPMELSDLDEVMRIERLSHSAAWPVSAYRHELEENSLAHYLILHSGDLGNGDDLTSLPRRFLNWLRHKPASGRALMGYGGFWLMVDEAHISTIAVDPAWRGMGLGELILLALIEQAITLGAILVTLEVRISNQVAQRLYRKYGFEVVGQRKRYYRDNHEDAHIMTVEEVQEATFRAMLDRKQQELTARLTARLEEDHHGEQ